MLVRFFPVKTRKKRGKEREKRYCLVTSQHNIAIPNALPRDNQMLIMAILAASDWGRFVVNVNVVVVVLGGGCVVLFILCLFLCLL